MYPLLAIFLFPGVTSPPSCPIVFSSFQINSHSEILVWGSTFRRTQIMTGGFIHIAVSMNSSPGNVHGSTCETIQGNSVNILTSSFHSNENKKEDKKMPCFSYEGFLSGSAGKESACNMRSLGSVPGLGRSPGEGKGCPLQFYGLENSMERIVLGVAKSQTQLNDFHFINASHSFKLKVLKE